MSIDFFKFFMVVSDIIIVVVYGERRMDDIWEVNYIEDFVCFFYVFCGISVRIF